MSDTKLEMKQSVDEDKRKIGLENLDVNTLGDIISETVDKEQAKELRTMLVDFIIAYGLDIKYFK